MLLQADSLCVHPPPLQSPWQVSHHPALGIFRDALQILNHILNFCSHGVTSSQEGRVILLQKDTVRSIFHLVYHRFSRLLRFHNGRGIVKPETSEFVAGLDKKLAEKRSLIPIFLLLKHTIRLDAIPATMRSKKVRIPLSSLHGLAHRDVFYQSFLG